MLLAVDLISKYYGSGTKSYNINFCNWLMRNNKKNKIFIFTTTEYLKNLKLKNKSNITVIVKPKYFTNILIRFLWMQFYFPFELKKLKISRLFSPMNFSPLLINKFGIDCTLALHTNLPWVHFALMPGSFLRKILTKKMMELSIFSSNKLIVNSYYAKRELVKKLKIKKKVYVIYLGIDEKYLQKKKVNNINNFNYKNYILSVTSCVKYHNILNILESFKKIKNMNKFFNLRLVLVLQVLDKNYFNQINNFIFKNFNINDVIIFHNLESKYLPKLYSKSNLYIFSSYSEVFGLTSLEAMAQRCPVLISNKSALPEINSNAALYFNPDSVSQISEGIVKILDNKKIKNRLIIAGKKNIKRFDWNKTVRLTLNIINK